MYRKILQIGLSHRSLMTGCIPTVHIRCLGCILTLMSCMLNPCAGICRTWICRYIAPKLYRLSSVTSSSISRADPSPFLFLAFDDFPEGFAFVAMGFRPFSACSSSPFTDGFLFRFMFVAAAASSAAELSTTADESQTNNQFRTRPSYKKEDEIANPLHIFLSPQVWL